MKRTVLLGTLIAALLAPFAIAHAHSNVAVSVSTPEFGIRIGAPVYQPVPVYAPAPVYIPAPVYAPPPTVYVPAPRVIYRAPIVVPAPRYIVPAPVYYGRPGVRVAPRPYGYRYWDHRREERRDHNGQRAGYGF